MNGNKVLTNTREMKRCSNCGAKLPNKAKYCGYCSALVPAEIHWWQLQWWKQIFSKIKYKKKKPLAVTQPFAPVHSDLPEKDQEIQQLKATIEQQKETIKQLEKKLKEANAIIQKEFARIKKDKEAFEKRVDELSQKLEPGK